MLYDPARHERLELLEWDDAAARRMIERIGRDTERRYARAVHWPLHPLDSDYVDEGPFFNLYFGAAGVVWALHYLRSVGALDLECAYEDYVDGLPSFNRRWLNERAGGEADAASYLMGDTGILMLSFWLSQSAEKAAQLANLIEANVDHPSRELMWGAPGTLLAARLLHRWTGEARWSELFVATARRLRSQLLWSNEYRCRYWTQDLYGDTYTALDAVHGFVATAAVIIEGRDLLAPDEWRAWESCFVDTIEATVVREDGQANWPPCLYSPNGSNVPQKRLMQLCHGAPGFVICLAGLPSNVLDDALLEAGEAIWAGGPLRKGSNLCHGTGGNGYAFLKLYGRTGDARWLARARAFAMHGIAQTNAHAQRYGQLRYSLWTGDLGFAIYLWDCIQAAGKFPTLETFFV